MASLSGAIVASLFGGGGQAHAVTPPGRCKAPWELQKPRRLRFRSGDYPEEAEVPSFCDARLLRPGLEDVPASGGRASSSVARHPLQRAFAMNFYGSPVELATLYPQGLSDRVLYAADHLRYGLGGGVQAMRWLQARENAEHPPAGDSAAHWAQRSLSLLAAARALLDGEPAQELAGQLEPWAFEPTVWAELFETRWHEGIFSGLAIVAELLCHQLAAGASLAGRPLARDPRCDSAPVDLAAEQPGGGGLCAAQGAIDVLTDALWSAVGHAAMGPALALSRELVDGCSFVSVTGAASWRAVWRRLSTWNPGGGEQTGESACFDQQLSQEATASASTLCVRMCGDRPILAQGTGDSTVHVLGATVALVGQAGPNACVIVEASIFVASRDPCFITQAGSNVRTLPHAFLADWHCSLSTEPHAAASEEVRGTVISAFGTDSVVRCAFKAAALMRVAAGRGLDKFGSWDSGADASLLYLNLRSQRYAIVNIPFCLSIDACGAGSQSSGSVGSSSGSRGGNSGGTSGGSSRGDTANAASADPQPSLLAPSSRPRRRRLTACTGVLFNADLRLPGKLGPLLIDQWLAYHELLGVDRFAVYDSDGSAARGVAALQARVGAAADVVYFPRWPSRLSGKMQSISEDADCRHCASAQAEVHCLFASRGVSDWVVTLHSFDTYLTVYGGNAGIEAILGPLESERPRIGTVGIPMLDFGGTARNVSLLPGRFWHRHAEANVAVVEIARGSPWPDSWLNHPGATMKNPENIVGVYDHYARSRPGAVDVQIAHHSLFRVNHYVDAVRPRCNSGFQRCEVTDKGLLWAPFMLCERLGWPVGCGDERHTEREHN